MPDAVKELIINAQRGDMRAFEQLVNLYDKKVLGLALRYAKNEDDAKDIYQEVFIRVYKGIKNFKFKSQFSTWLFRITTNVCLTFIEKEKRKSTVSLDQKTEFAGDDEQLAFQIRAGDPLPDQVVHNKEIIEAVKKELTNLSPQQRMVFTLKNYDGYKIREIAEMMNCTEGTVKKYLFTANRKMRTGLAKIIN